MKSIFLICSLLLVITALHADPFHVQLSPPNQTVTAGDQAHFTLSFSVDSAFHASIVLAVATGYTVDFDSKFCNPPYAAQQMIVHTNSGDTGMKALQLVASTDNYSDTLSFTLHVISNPMWTTMKYPINVNRMSELDCDRQGNMVASTSLSTVTVNRYHSGAWSAYLAPMKSTTEQMHCAFDSQNSYWFPTSVGLGYFDGTATTVYTHANSQLPSDNLLACCIDADNQPIVATIANTLYRRNSNGSYTTINSSAKLSTYIRKMAVDLRNRLVVCSEGDKPLVLRNDTSLSVWPVTRATDFCIAADSTIWFVGSSVENDFAIFSMIGDSVHAIAVPGNTIDRPNEIAVDSRGVVWLAAASGVYRYDHGTWTLFSSSNTIISPVDQRIEHIGVDGFDNVWLSTLTQFYVFNENGLIGIPLVSAGVESEAALSSDEAFVVSNNMFTIQHPSADVIVYDALGSVVQHLPSNGADKLRLSFEGRPPGLYLVQNGQHTIRLLVPGQ